MDEDSDGVGVWEDCDDDNSALLSVYDDGDCDGVATALDCDDDDPTLGAIANDPDCDGVIDCLGLSAGSPANSCDAALTMCPSLGDGNYLIDPDLSGAFSVYCDMTNNGGGWTRVRQLYNSTFENNFLSDFDGMQFTQFVAIYGAQRIWSNPTAVRTMGVWESNCGPPRAGSSPCYAWPGFNRWDGGSSHIIAMAQQAQAEMGNFGGFFTHCNGPWGPGFGFSQRNHCSVSRQLHWNGSNINGPFDLYLR